MRSFIISILFINICYTNDQSLYNSLDPLSISQHLAFYELYPYSKHGKTALKEALKLLTNNKIELSKRSIKSIIDLVNRQSEYTIDTHYLPEIKNIGNVLANRKLKGYYAPNESEILDLHPHEIDLSRALLLTMFDYNDTKVDFYETILDLMALQILTYTSLDDSPENKIHAINNFIFKQCKFRFPPHSLWSSKVEKYTFLPFVIDSKKGVCLGISSLYICIAQRLNLNLEMVTPPGHIYLRYHDNNKTINIETTARGINIPSEEYLDVNTHSLPHCNIKEVIGLTFFNQAASFWQNEKYENAIIAYEKALKYLPNNQMILEFLGYNYLFMGNKNKANKYLLKVKDFLPTHAVTKNTTAEDYLLGNIDIEGIKALYNQENESKESMLKQSDTLIKILKKHPKFRSGIMQLAMIWLQLGRNKKAISAFKKYHQVYPTDPICEYYLSVLYKRILNYPKAWYHLKKAESITLSRNYMPKSICYLRKELSLLAPE